MNPIPGVTNGEALFPDFLTLEDPSRAHEVADSHLIAGNWLREEADGASAPGPLRQYLAAVYLAHTGIFIDSEGRIAFDLTDEEAVGFLASHTERAWTSVERERRILSGDVSEKDEQFGGFSRHPFVRFNRYRTCRNSGETCAPAFRLYPQLIDPVTESG